MIRMRTMAPPVMYMPAKVAADSGSCEPVCRFTQSAAY